MTRSLASPAFVILLLLAIAPHQSQALAMIAPLPRLTNGNSITPINDNRLIAITLVDPLKGTTKYLCAGVIIDESHVLTVSHAVREYEPEQLCVLLPTKGTIENKINDLSDIRLVTSAIYGTSCQNNEYISDITILTMNQRIEGIEPIQIYTGQETSGSLFCTVWDGSTGKLQQLQTTMGIITSSDVSSHQDSSTDVLQKDKIIMAMPRDKSIMFGPGSSGTPLYATIQGSESPQLIGIASYQIRKNSDEQTVCFERISEVDIRTASVKGTETENRPKPNFSKHFGGITILNSSSESQPFVFTTRDTEGTRGELLIRHFLIKPDSKRCSLTIRIDDSTTCANQQPYVTIQTFPKLHTFIREYVNGAISIETQPEQAYLISIEIKKKDVSESVPFTISVKNY